VNDTIQYLNHVILRIGEYPNFVFYHYYNDQMNQTYFHLIFNHFPVIMPILGLLVMIFGLIYKSEPIKRWAYFVFIIGALATIPAYTTGVGSEEIIENSNGISVYGLNNHERMATNFAMMSYLFGLFAVFGFWASWKKNSFSNVLTLACVFWSLMLIYLGAQTSITGGDIRRVDQNEVSTPNLTKTNVKK
jgi:uncharacterized membrane protein